MVTIDGNGEGLPRRTSDPETLRLVAPVPIAAPVGRNCSTRFGGGGRLLEGHRTVDHHIAAGPVEQVETPTSPAGESPRVIAHVDLDAFFASVEQVLNPRLAGKPVVVGGRTTERGVVTSASYEARARGVQVAMPLFRAYRLCPEGHFVRGCHETYSEFSKRIFAICRAFSPVVTQTSIDEGYLDLTGTERCRRPRTRQACGGRWPIDIAERLRDRVRIDTGLHVSVGIATTRLVAKVAGNYAKPNGLCYVQPGEETAFLAPMAVRVLPGIGPRTADVLAEYNLVTVRDLWQCSLPWLRERFGASAGEMLYRKARGGCGGALEFRDEPRSISRETTFDTDTADPVRLRETIHGLVGRAAWKLRRLGLRARTVTLKLRYRDFQTVTRSRSLGYFTDLDYEVYQIAAELLDGAFRRRTTVRLIGVQLSHFARFDQRQLHLWNESARIRRTELYLTTDRIRARFGAVGIGVGHLGGMHGEPPRSD